MNALKLSVLGAAVAAFGVGCASSGHARYDADQNNAAGAAASSEMGTANDDDRAAASSTVSTLGRSVETRADWVNKFPFYNLNMRTIETYTFAVPETNPKVTMISTDLPEFSASLPPGSVYVEAAGGAGEARTGRVIQHTSNPSR